MRTSTITGATAILEVAANHLKGAGRPRKPLGKPRPRQHHEQMSLPAALVYARKLLGATRRQYETAADAIESATWHSGYPVSWSKMPLQNIEEFDARELDTRQVIRVLSKAAKLLAEQ